MKPTPCASRKRRAALLVGEDLRAGRRPAAWLMSAEARGHRVKSEPAARRAPRPRRRGSPRSRSKRATGTPSACASAPRPRPGSAAPGPHEAARAVRRRSARLELVLAQQHGALQHPRPPGAAALRARATVPCWSASFSPGPGTRPACAWRRARSSAPSSASASPTAFSNRSTPPARLRVKSSSPSSISARSVVSAVEAAGQRDALGAVHRAAAALCSAMALGAKAATAMPAGARRSAALPRAGPRALAPAARSPGRRGARAPGSRPWSAHSVVARVLGHLGDLAASSARAAASRARAAPAWCAGSCRGR